MDSRAQFEQRKKDHIRLALDDQTEARGLSGLDQIELLHEALPELRFSDVSVGSEIWGQSLQTPFLISSMTAGHAAAPDLNSILAEAAQARGWMMGVGSQRKELTDPEAAQEWRQVRKRAPKAVLIGNLGLSQVARAPWEQVQTLVENLEAQALFVHTNPLQEVLQPEGTPDFRGGLEALRMLSQRLTVPVILKEVGCGFSHATLQRLKGLGLFAVDVAGLGGTHWGRIEGARAKSDSWQFVAAQTFADWGHSTLQSLLSARELDLDYRLWASGGLRSGLDAAKVFALGAEIAGFAKPILAAALEGERNLHSAMERIEQELRIALFCTGCENLRTLQQRGVWKLKDGSQR